MYIAVCDMSCDRSTKGGNPNKSQSGEAHMRYVLVSLLLVATLASSQGPTSSAAPKVRSNASIKFADEYCSAPGRFDYTCIQGAVNDSKGGSVMLPPGAYAVSQTINVTTNGVCVEGYGSGLDADAGPAFSGVTYLRWSGPAGGTVLNYSAISGPQSGRLMRACLKNVLVDCAGRAAVGLAINSVAFSIFDSLTFVNCTTAGIKFGFVTPLASERDDQYNQLSNIDIREYETSGDAISLNGDANSNTSENLFLNLRLKHTNGNGLACSNDDNNVFVKVTCSRPRGGTGACVHFTTEPGGTSNAKSAHEETIFGIDEGAGGILQDQFADQNAVYGVTTGNGAGLGIPTNKSSGTLTWTSNDSGTGGWNITELILGSTTFAHLRPQPNGAMIYCADCTVASPASCINSTTTAACSCTGGGGGTMAKRISGAWLCQ